VPALPATFVVGGGSATFQYPILEDEEAEDFVVEYGKDLDNDGRLEGEDEVFGEYRVFGVTDNEYADARFDYNALYFPVMVGLEEELHSIFALGRFEAPVLRPNAWTHLVDVESHFLTHPAGFYGSVALPERFDAGGRPYANSRLDLLQMRWNAGSGGSEVVKTDEDFQTGLQEFLSGGGPDGLAYDTIHAAFGPGASGTSRELTFSLNGARFGFGFGDPPGLGGVVVGEQFPETAGTVTVQVTKIGSTSPSYVIDQDIVDLDAVVRDIFDFNYVNPAGIILGHSVSRNASSIQIAFDKPGAAPADGGTDAVGRPGQVILAEFEIDLPTGAPVMLENDITRNP